MYTLVGSGFLMHFSYKMSRSKTIVYHVFIYPKYLYTTILKECKLPMSSSYFDNYIPWIYLIKSCFNSLMTTVF